MHTYCALYTKHLACMFISCVDLKIGGGCIVVFLPSATGKRCSCSDANLILLDHRSLFRPIITLPHAPPTYTYARTLTYARTHTHTYIHTHIHTYTHIYIQGRESSMYSYYSRSCPPLMMRRYLFLQNVFNCRLVDVEFQRYRYSCRLYYIYLCFRIIKE